MGLGHVTGGEVDVNDNGTIGSSASLSGTYSFEANVSLVGGYSFNGNAQGVLGTMALTYDTLSCGRDGDWTYAVLFFTSWNVHIGVITA
jgi:hypothetical protein